MAEAESQLVPAGKISQWLTENGFGHESLAADVNGVEIIQVERDFLLPTATALYAYGFNYLQFQGGADLGPGQDLVSIYHLIKVGDNADKPEEIRLKVFLPRENPTGAFSLLDLENCRLARARVLRSIRHCIRRTPEFEADFNARRLGGLAFA